MYRLRRRPSANMAEWALRYENTRRNQNFQLIAITSKEGEEKGAVFTNDGQ